MKNSKIERSTFTFLTQLAFNNDRDWFAKNKNEYEAAKLNVETFINGLIEKMNVHDSIETPSSKKSLYRIYNDVRFSADKTPYNPRFAGYLKRTKPHLRGGYYYWIKPGGSRIGCGFVYPNADDLKRIREDIDVNYDDWNKLLKKKIIVSNFGMMTGHKVKTSPRGYSKDHPGIELLRLKQFWFEKTFSDREVLSADFLHDLSNSFKAIRPFFNYMSDVLTSNANGESILLR
jgi:uncharacterized protein (TIGR02453 family)